MHENFPTVIDDNIMSAPVREQQHWGIGASFWQQ
jgi:hypothetical protein